jgi:hypothetical protein
MKTRDNGSTSNKASALESVDRESRFASWRIGFRNYRVAFAASFGLVILTCLLVGLYRVHAHRVRAAGQAASTKSLGDVQCLDHDVGLSHDSVAADSADLVQVDVPESVEPGILESNQEVTEPAAESANAPQSQPDISTDGATDTGGSIAHEMHEAGEQPRFSSPGIRALAEASDPRGGAESERTGKLSARFFGLAAEETHSVVYVVDCSGSMGRPPMKLLAAKEELIRSIRALDDEQSFYVYFFSHHMFAMPGPGLLPASDANKDRVSDWIDGAVSGGGTNPFPPVAHALELRPETIYVLSDGLFKGEYVRAIRARNRGPRQTTIYTIGFGDRRGEKQLIRLARENGGSYRYVEPVTP